MFGSLGIDEDDPSRTSVTRDGSRSSADSTSDEDEDDDELPPLERVTRTDGVVDDDGDETWTDDDDEEHVRTCVPIRKSFRGIDAAFFLTSSGWTRRKTKTSTTP